MKIDKDELSRLPLAERIKRLKEIEEETKSEIREAKKLIKETETEIKTAKIASDVGPAPSSIEISDLFKAEEGIAAKAKAGEKVKVEYSTKPEYEPASAYDVSPPAQIDDSITIKSTSKEVAEKSATSAGIIEYLKKYTRG